MTTPGYGPLWRVNGPPPIRPTYGLLQVAEGPVPVVRINPPTDLLDADQIERWLNGVEIYPYPPDTPGVFDTCAAGSDQVAKAFGGELPHPQFGAMTVYLAETCTSRSVWSQDEYRARASLALAAVQGFAIEHEFMTGDVLGLNPHLTDGNGTFPYGDVVTSVENGLAMLENEIARSARQGIIHCTPSIVTAFAAHFLIDRRDNVIRTQNGTVVIPGFGYVDGGEPDSHAAPADVLQEWIYATGPIDIRQSDLFMTPENVSQALERGTGGADTGRPNTITYRAERYFNVAWDTVVQAAVLVDRCQSGCGTPPS